MVRKGKEGAGRMEDLTEDYNPLTWVLVAKKGKGGRGEDGKRG